MNTLPSWLLLRIPRVKTATKMSGVLGVGSYVVSLEGDKLPAVCDALLAKAQEAGQEVGRVILVYPLDGRHNIAEAALVEAHRRTWGFARHVPRGTESYLLDLDGDDAEPALKQSELPARIEEITKEIQSALEASELGEVLAGLRQMMTLTLRHLGAWHPDTYWAASNLLRVAGGTGAPANIDQAAGLLEHLLSQPIPDKLANPVGLMRKFDETAKNAIRCGQHQLSTRLMEVAVELAKREFGEGHPDHLAMQNNACLLLSFIKSPKAEPALRELLRVAREKMGVRHPNVAVVLLNLAELLENLGRPDEAKPLRAEAESIRAA